MFEPRLRLADAHHAGFSAGPDGLRDDPALVQRGWDVWTDFGAGQLYDQARGRALTGSGAVAWAATPTGAALDFAAAAANCYLDFTAYQPPTRYTVATLFVVGTIQGENIISWVDPGDPSTYDRQIRLTGAGQLEWYAFTGATITGATTLTAGQLVHAVAVFDGASHLLYVNGRLDASASSGSGGFGGFGSNAVVRMGYKSGHGSFASSTYKMLAAGVAPVVYDAGQVFELWQRPFGQVAPRRRTRGAPAASGVSVTLTGSAITSSAGTLGIAHANALTGSAITSNAGTVVPGLAAALTGSAITLAGGIVVPGLAPTLGGSAATASAGTVGLTHGNAVTGAAITAGQGTVVPGITAALVGSFMTGGSGTLSFTSTLTLAGTAATFAAGTVSVGTDLGLTLTGALATFSAGTVVPAIGLAVSGAAITASAGSLAYTAAFSLVGISTGTAIGSLSTSGGAGEVITSLRGEVVRVLPGNVRVTGGVRWTPQSAQAVVPPSMVGNTLPPPPRLTGDPQSDVRAQQQWLATVYDRFIKELNALGRLVDHEDRIARLENPDDPTIN